MDEIIGLPADVTTALTVIVTVVVIPVVTALVTNPSTPPSVKRWLPVGLAALAAVFIVWVRAGGPFVDQVFTWIVLAATVVGLAQALYAVMPGTWKQLSASTSRGTPAAGTEPGLPRENYPGVGPSATDPILGRESGAQRYEDEERGEH